MGGTLIRGRGAAAGNGGSDRPFPARRTWGRAGGGGGGRGQGERAARACVRALERVHMCVRARARARACVHVRVCARGGRASARWSLSLSIASLSPLSLSLSLSLPPPRHSYRRPVVHLWSVEELNCVVTEVEHLPPCPFSMHTWGLGVQGRRHSRIQ